MKVQEKERGELGERQRGAIVGATWKTAQR